MAYNLGFSGILGWAADFYDTSRNQDPWTDVSYFNAGRAFNGDVLWFYPGRGVGLPGSIVPSIQAKWLRDGIEDYEYLRLLHQSGLNLRVGTLRLHSGQALAEEMARSFRDWQKDPAQLEAARKGIGEILDQKR